VSGILKILFARDDLARIRVASQPDPLWELVTSLNKISTSIGGVAYSAWRSFARTALLDQPRQIRGVIRDLVPPKGDFPDFLTPTAGAPDVKAVVEAVMTTPSSQLRRDLEFIAQKQHLPRWTEDLAAGEPATMRRLGEVLTTYHHTLLQPFWPTVQAHADADRSLRARTVLDGGGEALLNSFRPTLRWNPPTLEADYPVNYDVDLQGRGLTLVPSYFCWGTPITLIDKNCPVPVLVYPLNHDLTITAAAPTLRDLSGADRRLAALIGRTRSQILIALNNPHTTSELARKFDVSAAAVSQHTSVLRRSGLITTRRDANTVIHIATRLGVTLYQ
jgi:DNA-binding transcriptional ArsR family regulator